MNEVCIYNIYCQFTGFRGCLTSLASIANGNSIKMTIIISLATAPHDLTIHVLIEESDTTPKDIFGQAPF
jgi:hypothetical protein